MGQPFEPPTGDGIESVELKAALEERYLAYALSTIMHRALPDARDGLKPVHRRILYGMRLLRLDPNTAYKKCAKIVGDVMGDFHPHGDQAIYDALVRLAQDFAQRYPLVDGQGNFGNIDGDSPAAYRYTEARLTEVARLLLDGIDEDTVDFRADLQRREGGADRPPGGLPEPARQRHAGHRGRHGDLDPAAQRGRALRRGALPDQPSARRPPSSSCTFVPGPDFPTGGILVESERGHRGRPTAPAAAPSGCAPAGPRRISAAAPGTSSSPRFPTGCRRRASSRRSPSCSQERKLPLLADVRDESAEDVRVVLEPRSRTVDPVDPDGIAVPADRAREPHPAQHERAGRRRRAPGDRPRRSALREWLDHRRVVLPRRSRHRLGQIERRLEILGGLLIVYLDLDEVIRIIREEDEPKPALMRASSSPRSRPTPSSTRACAPCASSRRWS